MSSQKQFSHAATILKVADVIESSRYYQEKLGFTLSYLHGAPPYYATLNREDAVSIHLSQIENWQPLAITDFVLYVFVHNVDLLFEEYQNAGVEIVTPLNDTDYKMREFDVRDLNGYGLTFGTGLDHLN